MVGLILVLLLCTVLAGGVIGYVAWQARLDGRQVLTETGEEALSGLRRRAATAGELRRRRSEPTEPTETSHGAAESEDTAVGADRTTEPRQPSESAEAEGEGEDRQPPQRTPERVDSPAA